MLLAIMLQFLHPIAALPVHGAVQLASNTTRVWLFWKDLSWPIIGRFIALMPIGVWMGLKLFQGLPAEGIQILIGLFVLLSLLTSHIRRWRPKDLPLWAFVPLGLVTGALNMVVGVISPILGALIIRKDLSKEGVVGTLGFFGFAGNLLKITGFSFIGFSFVEFGPLILAMVPAAIIGTHLGKRILQNVNEASFRIAFQLVLIALALKLIFVDGFALFG